MNEENIRKRIRDLLNDIQSEADPALLNRCRSIFRKEVSFFNRSYMAAYLLLLAEGVPVKRTEQGSKHSGRNKQPDVTEISQVLSEDESVQLFVSIGRNRKVFPREILALVNARAKIAREDIGIIRILDNYSFVQVRNNVADIVIEALNGHNFRGRTLTVNYARSRRESDDDLQ